MARNIFFKQAMRLLRTVVEAENRGWSDKRLISEIEKVRDAKSVSRREMLKTSLAVGATVGAMGSLSGMFARDAMALDTRQSLKKHTNADSIVIIGAGIAGLVTAYRLQLAGIPVAIYEGSNRLGGRVLTKDKFNADEMYCELGGELIDREHYDILRLCKELGVPVESTPQFDVGVEPDLFHFGGKVITQKEMIPAFRPLARHLARDIKACFPDGNVRMPTYDDIGIHPEVVKKFDNISMHDYLYSKTDVDKWVLQAVDVLYVCEYGMDAKEQSAMNLLVLIEPDQKPKDFNLLGESDESMRVRGGNSRLVEALEKRITRYSPEINFKHKLVRIEDEGGKIVLTFDADGGRKTVRAARVVSAIPLTTLRKVEGLNELKLTDLKKKCIAELGYGTNTKFMVGFKERYWRKRGQVSPGSRITMISDQIDQSYWETSKGQKGKSGILTNYTGGSRSQDSRSITERLGSVLTEMEKVYPGMKSGHDGNVAFFQWGKYDMALGSYVSPYVGQYTTLWGSASVPELDGRLYFAGEHASIDGAGYINGGVQSGNQAAEQILQHQRASKKAKLPA